MEIQGKVIAVLPIQGGVSTTTGKPWQIETFVIETLESYPRKVALDIFGEQRIKDYPVAIDQVVTVSFDLESRDFNGRWYTSARAWKIEQGAAQSAAQQAAQPMAAVPVATPVTSPAPAAVPAAAPVPPATQATDPIAEAAAQAVAAAEAEGKQTGLPF